MEKQNQLVWKLLKRVTRRADHERDMQKYPRIGKFLQKIVPGRENQQTERPSSVRQTEKQPTNV